MELSDLKRLSKHEVTDLLRELSFREREVLRLLGGVSDGYEYTLDEVAHIFGIDAESIQTIANRAWVKLQQGSLLRDSVTGSIDVSTGRVQVSGVAVIGEARSDGVEVTLALPEFADDEAIVDTLVDLYRALNDMHVAAGGGGLKVDEGQSLAGMLSVEGVPQ
ncbi:sigma factor-like helix-turn-helix DNA-binding protein [Lacipirellula parvula]|uniref:RNA polymerase sigma-70 region 4 domain-containing protein n=1 Tax=Lacipirellula parvula TaxID=2650471 RepID=A0A5K7XAY4_9BACT|nr:sigma factor-like helix-turn-helix DNA-binding protein [Lacipirellula parvula]BBO31961.1 hypothetical protein PLANPX_1573 [Lacipirellula parvula]